MSRIYTVLGVIVALAAQLTPVLATDHPTIAFWLTVAGLGAAAIGGALLNPTARNSKTLKSIALLGVVTAALFASGCGNVGKAIVRYADKGTRAIERLKEAQEIDVEDADRILPLIADARKIGVEYDAVEQAIKAATSPTEKASKREQLRAVGQQVMASLRRLDTDGVLKIKNEQRRNRVRKVLVYGEILADLVT